VLATRSADTPPLADGEEWDSMRRQIVELQQKVDRLESLADARTAALDAGVDSILISYWECCVTMIRWCERPPLCF
jgi:hypothetical protein